MTAIRPEPALFLVAALPLAADDIGGMLRKILPPQAQ
jgi:hypothetical protein